MRRPKSHAHRCSVSIPKRFCGRCWDTAKRKWVPSMTRAPSAIRQKQRNYFGPKRVSKEVAMKIAIIGQQDFGKSVLEAFLARGDEVAGVFCAPEKAGAKPDPLKVAAEEKALKVFQFKSLRDKEAHDAMRALDAE